MFKNIVNNIDKKNLYKLNELLSQHPKYINVQNKYGVTALILSVKLNNYDIFLNLLKMNPNLYLSTKIIYTPLHKTQFNKINFGENNALWWASKLNRTNMVKKIIKLNFDLKCFKNDISPLFFAIRNNNMDLLIFLLKNGSNYNHTFFDKKMFDYNYPIKECIYNNNFTMLSILLKQKNIKKKDTKSRIKIKNICKLKKKLYPNLKL